MNKRFLSAEIVIQQISNLLLVYPDLADDESFRVDMIEGSTDTFEYLRKLERERREALKTAEALGSLITDYEARQQQFERRAQARRDLMFKILSIADIKKCEMPEATLSIRNGAAKTIITNEQEIPAEYWRVKRELDRAKINEALKAGLDIPGANLSNSEPTLSIRAK